MRCSIWWRRVSPKSYSGALIANGKVPGVDTTATLELRERFKAALAAHQSAITALAEATAGGQPATQELIEAEHKSLVAMVAARDALLAAIAAEPRLEREQRTHGLRLRTK
jgi:hypothetical protein